MNQYLQSFMPGLASLPNLHPLAVHFPIALLSAFFLVELLRLLSRSDKPKIAADWLLYLGTLGALGATIMGLIASQTAEHEGAVHQIMTDHRNWGLNTTALAVILSLWRLLVGVHLTKMGHLFHLIMGAAIFFNLMRGADLGGVMVYQYGVGVEAVRMHARHTTDQTQRESSATEADTHDSDADPASGHEHGHAPDHKHDTIQEQIQDWFEHILNARLLPEESVKVRPHSH